MSKTATLRQSAAASNETHIADLASRIETLRQTKHQSVEELAAALEPIAQAMAKLTDETRQTLAEIEARTKTQGETFAQQLTTSATNWKDAAKEAEQAADRLDRAGSRLEWRHYLLAMHDGRPDSGPRERLVALAGAAEGEVQNHLDPKAVAELLKPAVIEALKPSRGR